MSLSSPVCFLHLSLPSHFHLPCPSVPSFSPAHLPHPSATPIGPAHLPRPSVSRIGPPICPALLLRLASPSALPICLAHRPPISSKLHAHACLQCSYVLDPVTNMTRTASMEVRHFVVVNDKGNIVVRGRANVCLNLCT